MKVLKRLSHQQQKTRRETSTDRQERIPGWRQDRLSQGRALVVGAGALGNEVVKNLALMGIGYILVADFDQVERSNLSRAVLFRKSDTRSHRSKAEVVARRAKVLNVMSQAHVQPFYGDVVWELGSGVFRRVDVVIGCLDNVEARMVLNAACLFTGTPFIDGGILGLAGNVTAVHPPLTACWECTTTSAEREGRRNRYDSCSKVMRRDLEAGRLPAVQVASSIIAGFQTQEAVKVLQGHSWAAGLMIQYNAGGKRPDLDVVTIARRPDCWCNKAETIKEVIELPLSATTNTLRDLIQMLQECGVADPQVVLPDSFVIARYCKACQTIDAIMQPTFRLDTGILFCPFCGAKSNKIELLRVETSQPSEFKNIDGGESFRERMMSMSLVELGFPRLALVSFYNTFPLRQVAELSADAAQVMGGERYAGVHGQ